MAFGIDKYIGTWIDEDGFRLEIKKVNNIKALVSLFSPDGSLIERPYWNNKVTKDMEANYDEYYGEFDIHLWTQEKGFCLSLSEVYEFKETLAPSISRYEEDDFLDSFYLILGRLKDFKKCNEKS